MDLQWRLEQGLVTSPVLHMRLREGQLFYPVGSSPFLAQTLSLPGSACIPYCCWLRSWIWWDLEELDFPGVSSDFLFPSAPSTIDWAALFISLIFAHPSAMLFSHLLCRGPEGPECSPVCVCRQAWESPCGFGTMGEDTSLPSFPWWQAGSHKHLNPGVAHSNCSLRSQSNHLI